MIVMVIFVGLLFFWYIEVGFYLILVGSVGMFIVCFLSLFNFVVIGFFVVVLIVVFFVVGGLFFGGWVLLWLFLVVVV